MTNKEAIYILRNAAFLATLTSYQAIEDAVEVAVKALTSATDINVATKNCSDCIANGGDYECDHVHCRKGNVPDINVGDIIYRQDAIDALKKCHKHCIDPFDSYHIDIEDAEAQLINLPSAQPERKTGHWISVFDEDEDKCSVCQATFFCALTRFDFCPNCGADMRTAKCGTKTDLCIMDEVEGLEKNEVIDDGE